MSKTKEEKRKFRASQKQGAKAYAKAKREAEKKRLENKTAEAYPQIDPAFLKAIDDYFAKEAPKPEEPSSKKKGKGKKIACAVAAFLLAGSCTGYTLYRNNKPNNDGPKDTDPVSTMEQTSEPTNEPTYDIPSATPTAGVSAAPTESVEPSAEPTATTKPNTWWNWSQRPSVTNTPGVQTSEVPTAGPTVVPTADPTGVPTADPTGAPTDHVHSFLDWFCFDDEKEKRECSICGEKEYRDHIYKHSYTVEKNALLVGYHTRVDDQTCINCGHEHEKKAIEKCTFGKMTYDDNYEYQECWYCHDELKTPHNLYTIVKGDYEITKCSHSGCGYEHKEYVGSVDTSYPPVVPTPHPTAKPTPHPTQNPSPEPTRNQDPDASNNPGIGDGGIKDFPDNSDPVGTVPPDIEIHTPAPAGTPAPVNTPAVESTPDPNAGRDPGKLDENGQTGIGTGGKKPFDDEGEEQETQASLERRLAALKIARERLESYITYAPMTNDEEKHMKFGPLK